MKEDELMVDVYMIVQKIFMNTVLFYKYLLTLLQKYYVDKGVMVNIPYLLNFKNLYYEKNLFDKLYTTNLSYIPTSVQNLDWIETVDCSKYLAKIIDRFNNNESINDLSNGSTKGKILTLINEKRNTTL